MIKLQKIPELVGYIFGSDEGFATLHTVVMTVNGRSMTCGAMVVIKPDNSVYVSVSNCGINHVNYLGSDVLIKTTKVE